MSKWGNFLNKVQVQASDAGARAQAGTASLMQTFSLPGECDKAAKILKDFLGEY